MTGYTDVMFDQPVVGEPSRSTQEFYGLLDTAVQSVLTDSSVDIDALLEDANSQAQTLLDAAEHLPRAGASPPASPHRPPPDRRPSWQPSRAPRPGPGARPARGRAAGA